MTLHWPAPSRRTLVLVHLAYVLIGGWLLLRPIPDAASTGVGWVNDAFHALGWRSLTGSQAEFLCNIALFVPPAVLWCVLVPRVLVWVWPTLGFASSCLVEAIQWAFLPDRSGSARDIVANTAGVLIGVALVWAWRWRQGRASAQNEPNSTAHSG